MNRRIPLLVAVATLALLLAGCGTDPEPVPKPTRSTAKPTPTPTIGQVAPAQDQVDAPKSADEAKAAAAKTITLYLRYNFELLAHPELGADYLKNYIDGNAIKLATDSAKHGVDEHRVALGGPVTFQPNYALSSTGVVKNTTDGTVYPNANAVMIGCADNGALKFSTNGADSARAGAARTFPDRITVQWSPELRVWRVIDAKDLTGQPGAPKC